MGLTLARANLLSRTVRQSITGSSLTRKLDLSSRLSSSQNDGTAGGNFFSNLFTKVRSWGEKLKGFLSNVLKSIQFSASGLWSLAVNAGQFISYFDWNASDRELQAQIDSRNIALAGTWGTTIGSGVGWLTGIAIGSGLTILCPVIGSARLAKIVAGKASLEALEEVGAETMNAVRQTVETIGANAFINKFRKVRRALGINPPDNAPVSSFATRLETRVESIKDPVKQAFVEGAVDGFFDSFIESGYVFAHELDAQLAASRAANSGGVSRAITLTPDKQAPDEKIVLVGGQDTLKTAVQTTLAQHRLLYNRDVGQLVGMPVEDWYKAKPHRRKLTVQFRDIEQPPFRKTNGERVKSCSYSIPEPKSGLSWATIRRACKPYTWGRFRCTANLTNGRQMAVYGASAQEAEGKLRDLLELSTCEISTVSITEEKQRNPKLKKDAVRMYPFSGSLLVRKPNLESTGRTDLDGKSWDEAHIKFELWPDREPISFDQVRW